MSAIADCLVAVLRKQAAAASTGSPGAGSASLGEIRRAIAGELGECSMAGLSAAIQSLRFAGKIQWDRLELSPSMRGEPEDDYPSQVNDEQQSASPSALGAPEALAKSTAEPGLRPPPSSAGIEPGAEETAAPVRTPGADPNPGVVQEGGGHSNPDRAAALQTDSRRGGVHAANTRAAVKPVPEPRHESEVARAAREEANEAGERRRSARSTATVSRPLAVVKLPPELKRYGIPDFTLSEAIGTMLSDDPRSIMLAVSRKHPKMWRRVILLSRELGKSPMQALYAALEAGLAALEPQEEARDAA